MRGAVMRAQAAARESFDRRWSTRTAPDSASTIPRKEDRSIEVGPSIQSIRAEEGKTFELSSPSLCQTSAPPRKRALGRLQCAKGATARSRSAGSSRQAKRVPDPAEKA